MTELNGNYSSIIGCFALFGVSLVISSMLGFYRPGIKEKYYASISAKEKYEMPSSIDDICNGLTRRQIATLLLNGKVEKSSEDFVEYSYDAVTRRFSNVTKAKVLSITFDFDGYVEKCDFISRTTTTYTRFY